MKILIVYGTTEGQTRKVARYVFDWLAGRGHSAELAPAGDAEGLSPEPFDGVILAASVHAGHYQAPLVDYAKAEAKALAAKPSLFLSVSLSAAGNDPHDWAGLRDCLRRFEAETGWTPGRVEHVAGAFRFSEYDFFKSWAMRWIAARRDEGETPGQDKEYTDWEALSSVLEDWTGGLSAGR
jgi:menaquinone-dependent protoporphyrinogen oxidase